METKIKFVYLIFIIFLSDKNINSTLIREGYHFFDIFYYKDIYKDFIKQKNNNKCTIDEGPNCYFLPKNKTEISYDLKDIFPENDSFLKDEPENIYKKIKEQTQLISNKDIDSLEEKLYSFDSPLVMSLFLTFESYDEKTRINDIYSPETIDTQFDVGRLTLTILGKLRISQKNAKLYESPNYPLETKDEKPKGSYAFVESKEVLIKFNSKAMISSLYIKRNNYNTKNKPFYLYGYKGEKKHLITKMENVPSSYWMKVNGDGNKYDSIILNFANSDMVGHTGSLEAAIKCAQIKNDKDKANFGNLCVALRGFRMVADATEALLINENTLKGDDGEFYKKVEDEPIVPPSPAIDDPGTDFDKDKEEHE